MARRAHVVILSLAPASLLLSACSFGNDDTDEGGAVASKQRRAALAEAGVTSLQPGLWVKTLQVNSVRLPAMARKREADIIEQIRKSAARTQCVSKTEAKTVPARLFAPDGKDCSYSKFAFESGQMQIDLSCGMESMSAIDMELAGQMRADSFDLDADISVRLPMIGKVAVEGKYTGRHSGDCE